MTSSICAPSRWMMTTDRITLTAVRAAAGGARVQIDAEIVANGEKNTQTVSVLTTFLKVLPQLGEISAEGWQVLCRLDELSRAIDVGLRMLSACGCSQRHLAEKLCARGFSRTVAARAAATLATRGYLSDRDGALREAERGVKKLWGDRRILAECRAKGYGEEGITAVQQYLRGENSTRRCRALLARRLKNTDDADEIRRAIAFLSRYGYGTDEIRAALRAVRLNIE